VASELDPGLQAEPEQGRPSIATAVVPFASFGAAQRAIESIIIAAAASTGLYLVGSVYAEAYYGRMSIDVTSLDLAPPYIALQATHVLQSLLQYPISLLIFFVIYRALSSRAPWLRVWYERIQQRFGRLFLLIVNLLIISPLLISAIRAGNDLELIYANSVLSEVAALMETFGVLLLFYVIWLSVGPRLLILTQIREHRIVPIALLFILYLLDAFVASAHGAALDAEQLMTGQSDSSIAIEFTLSDGARNTLPETELILVTARHGTYYVVERQPVPPSARPVAYMIPFDVVDVARLQRLTEADQELEDFDFDPFATPIGP
jgi:hypothetical protein